MWLPGGEFVYLPGKWGIKRHLLIKITEMKNELIKHLQTKRTDDVCGLWCEAKAYYKSKLIEMGGGYASRGKDISVTLNVNGELERFKVSIDECK